MIGKEIAQEAFRNTPTYYLEATSTMFSQNVLEFSRRHAGPQVLDYGCATGNYIDELQKYGFQCSGVDVNRKYVTLARRRGLDVRPMKKKIPFRARSFDTVLMIEVMEHLPDPLSVLAEVKRVARKNILLTVPNCEGYQGLRGNGLIFEHFLDRDHKNFFTPDSLGKTLGSMFSKFEIRMDDPIDPSGLIAHPLFRIPVKALYKAGILKTRYFSRLYAVIHLGQGDRQGPL